MLGLRYTLVTPAAGPPVLVDEVRAHLRVDDDDTSQDTLISLLIAAATRYAENYTGKALMPQTWRAVADGFPGCVLPVVPALPLEAVQAAPWATVNPFPVSWQDSIIELRRGPVQEVDSITYVDQNGTTQTLDPSAYMLDTSGGDAWPARLAPAYGSNWPAARAQLGSLKIQFESGYADVGSVPATIKTWMLVRIATAYEHREEEEIVARGTLQPLAYVDGLLDSERVGWL